MKSKEEVEKRNTEMTPFRGEYSLKSFFQNYKTISKIIIKNEKEFKSFQIYQVPYDRMKKDFEEKLLKGFKMNNFSEWSGTSLSKNPIRLLRIETSKFLKTLLVKLKKTNPSYEMFNKILYHYYYKYSVLGLICFFSFPVTFLALNKNFLKYGNYRFSPLLLLVFFSGLIRDNLGEIGLAKNSLFILFYLHRNLTNEDEELKQYISEFLKEKNIEFRNMPKPQNN